MTYLLTRLLPLPLLVRLGLATHRSYKFINTLSVGRCVVSKIVADQFILLDPPVFGLHEKKISHPDLVSFALLDLTPSSWKTIPKYFPINTRANNTHTVLKKVRWGKRVARWSNNTAI